MIDASQRMIGKEKHNAIVNKSLELKNRNASKCA
jgi:hypothetical protein